MNHQTNNILEAIDTQTCLTTTLCPKHKQVGCSPRLKRWRKHLNFSHTIFIDTCRNLKEEKGILKYIHIAFGQHISLCKINYYIL
jgi:hypothetical protein